MQEIEICTHIQFIALQWPISLHQNDGLKFGDLHRAPEEPSAGDVEERMSDAWTEFSNLIVKHCKELRAGQEKAKDSTRKALDDYLEELNKVLAMITVSVDRGDQCKLLCFGVIVTLPTGNKSASRGIIDAVLSRQQLAAATSNLWS